MAWIHKPQWDAQRLISPPALLSAVLVLVFSFLLATGVATAAPQSGQRFTGLFQVGSANQAAQRYDVVVLNEWNSSQISQLKAANPAVKVLLYKNTYFLRSDDNSSTVGGFKTGENINSNHPDWFLKDASGNRIVFQYYSGIDFYAMDWGNQAWRDYWVAQALGRVQALGFDGLFLDDLYTHPWGEIDRPLLNYTSESQLQAAVRGFLANTFTKTKAADSKLLVIGNLVDHLWFPGLFADWLKVSDGLMDEQFVHVGESTTTGYKSIEDWWKLQLDEVTVAEQMGKRALFISHGATTDYETMLFGYGSYMLAAGGNGRYYHELGGSLSTATWFDLWARDLGAAQGSYTVGSDGLYSRNFAGGKVIVNPSKSTTRTVSVSGYVNEGGTAVNSVTLAPHRAVFLFKTATTTTTVPPTTTTTLPPATTTTVAPTTTTKAPTTTTTKIPPTTTTVTTVSTTPPTPTTTTTVPPKTPVPPQALPVIQFVSPEDGALVKGRVTVQVKAASTVGILKVELLVDGKAVGSDKLSPYWFIWNADKASEGNHTLLAVAYDGVGNVAGTAITVKSITSSTAKVRAAIAASSYRFSGTSAFLNSTGVLYVE
ncbi:MAG: putative glycoside hydrolase [Thermoleophilia bacterium]